MSRNKLSVAVSFKKSMFTGGALAAVLCAGHLAAAQVPQPVTWKAVVFELSQPLENNPNFNWLAPPDKINGIYPARREHGARQVLFEPLFHLNLETGELEPWLGLTFEPDATQMVWTLTLRDGATWSDTMPKKPMETVAVRYPFTADDVVYTSDLILKHAEFSAYEASRFRAATEKVEKVDDLTVRFTLRKPNPRFAIENFGDTAFGSIMIMPKHIWEKAADPVTFAFDKPIGTGPYTLKQYTKDKVTYELDPGWWGAKAAFELPGGETLADGTKPKVKLPEPAELVWRFTEPAETLDLLTKEDNELDASRELSPEEFENAKQARPDKIIGWTPDSKPAWNTACARQLDINAQSEIVADSLAKTVEKNPWSDTALRRALSLLIDREKIAEAYGGASTPSTTMFAAYGAMRPFINAVEGAKAADSGAVGEMAAHTDVAAAERLLSDAGYTTVGPDQPYIKDGVPLTARIAVIEGTPDVGAADALKTQLDAAGITTTVDEQSNEQYWGWTVPYGHYQIAYGWLSCGSLAEPYTSMNRYAYSPEAANKDDPTFDNTGRWTVPADFKDALSAMATLPRQDSANASLPNPDLISRMLDAYRALYRETPLIPLVQTPRIIAFNTTRWTGWPTSDHPGNPAHDWGSMHKLLQTLTKAAP